MNSKRTLILGLLLIIIAGYFYFFEFRAAEQKEQAEKEAKKLLTLSPESIKEITLKTADETILLTRSNKEWKLEKPVSYKADQTEIRTMIQVLSELEKERVIEKNPADLTPFGLKSPGAEILIKTGKEEIKILCGRDNPTEEFTYAKTSKDPEVFLIRATLKNSILKKKAYALRDKTIVGIRAKEIRKIDLSGKDTPSIILERDSQENWQISKPLEAKGDQQAIENLLVRFQNDRVKAFIDEPEELSLYSLENPLKKIAFYQKEGIKSGTLLIGKKDKEEKLFYAKRDDLKIVFLIEKGLVEKLPNRVNDLRDRTLLSFNRQNVIRIELKEDKKETIVLKKENDTWNITSSVQTKADDLEIDNVLWVLENTQIKNFAEASRGLAAFGLKNPRRELRLWLKGKEKPESLFFGSTQNKDVFVKTADRDEIFLIESRMLRIFFRPLSALKERHILSFQEENITKVFVDTPQKQYSLIKEKGQWTFEMPPHKRRKIKEMSMKGLFWSLNDLRFIDIPGKAEPLVSGKEKSILNITLFEKGEKKRETLRFFLSPDKDDLVLIRADIQKKTFFSKKKSLESLSKALQKISSPAK